MEAATVTTARRVIATVLAVGGVFGGLYGPAEQKDIALFCLLGSAALFARDYFDA
jgi:hypothetical protein